MSDLPMIIDSFAGGGGASTGIELALGRSPDVAINHSAAALALHAANHPDTLHLDSNIWDVDPRTVTGGRPVGLLWASPDCKHFSKAKGSAPKDRNIRDLAWVVVRWMEQVKPDVVAMENVEEFRTWGPIDNDGQPIPQFIGQTFDDWCRRIRKAGYRMQWRELRGCDYGAPTIRKRFFMLARRDGRPIVWPKPTHGDPNSAEVKRGKLLPWRTAAECIDWSLPCPSIFESAPEIMAQHGLRAIRPLAANTLARVARGMKRYVLDAERPFLVEIGYSERPGQAPRTQDLAAPLATVVAGSVKHALVSPSITRFNGGATGQDLRGPLATITANSWIKKPGGAAPLGLLAPALATFYGHSEGRGIRSADLCAPLRTVTVENRHAVIAPILTHMYTSNRCGGEGDPEKPLKTVTSGGQHHALIAPHIMTMRNSAKPFNGADEPTHTVTAGGAGLTLVAPVLTYAQHGGAVRDMNDPVHTITASRKDQNQMFGAFLAQHHGGATGHDARDPISTIAATGSHQTPVAAFFAKYYGTGDGARTDEPCHTITVKDRFAHTQASLAAPPFQPEHETRAREVAAFLRAHDAWDDREFVTLTIDGVAYVVVDIGMRMLAPRELFNAQGFPADYVIEGVWQPDGDDWKWVPFTKNVQVSCCGNSVCPDVARALIAANCAHLIAQEAAA